MDKPELINLPITIYSRNKLDKTHWAEKLRTRKMYQLLVRNQMRLNKIPKSEPGSVYKLSIVVFKKYRIRDYDNLDGGCKILLDSLSREGFIWDDDMKYIGTPSITQQQSKEEYTLISRVVL